MKTYSKTKLSDIQEKLQKGVTALTELVASTMGPGGNTVMLQKGDYIVPTKDGFTVALDLVLEDPWENMGCQIAKQASFRTNAKVGDGTTSTTVLVKAIVDYLIPLSGQDRRDQIKQLEQWGKDMEAEIEKIAVIPVSEEEIFNITRVSSNGDSELAALVAEAIWKTGEHGFVQIDNHDKPMDELEIAQGSIIQSGMIHPSFVTDVQSGTAIMENPVVLVCRDSLKLFRDIELILEHAANNDRPLLIFASDVDGDVLPTLLTNHLKHGLQSCFVKLPGFIDSRTMEETNDIATIFGAEVTGQVEMKPLKDDIDLAWLGTAKQVIISKTQTHVTLADGRDLEMEELIEKIKIQKENCDPEDLPWYQKRLYSVLGKFATVRLKQATISQVQERGFRVEDAVRAGQSALKDGYVMGAGKALILANAELDNQSFFRIADSPMRQIMANLGVDVLDVPEEVVDPASVAIEGLKNAIEVAVTIAQCTGGIINQ